MASSTRYASPAHSGSQHERHSPSASMESTSYSSRATNSLTRRHVFPPVTPRPKLPSATQTLTPGISSSFFIPAPQNAFENFTAMDLRAPFKWVSSRIKKKRQHKAKNWKKKLVKMFPRWIQRRRKVEPDAGLTDAEIRQGALKQTRRMPYKGRGGKDNILHILGSMRVFNSFNNHWSFSSKSDDKEISSNEKNSTERFPSTEAKLEHEHPAKIDKWGHWNELQEESEIAWRDEISSCTGHEEEKRSVRPGLDLGCTNLPWSLHLKKRTSAAVCHVTSKLGSLDGEKPSLNSEAKKKNKGNTKSEVKGNCWASCAHAQNKDEKSYDGLRSTASAWVSHGKLVWRRLQKRFPALKNTEGSFGHGTGNGHADVREESAHSGQLLAPLIGSSVEIMRNETSMQNKRSNSNGSFIGSASERYVSTSRPPELPISADCMIVSGNVEPPMFNLDNILSRLSIDFLDSGSSHERSSAGRDSEGSQQDMDIAFLNAKMDRMLEHMHAAITLVADQVKECARLQNERSLNAEDQEESVHCRLTSSCTSHQGTRALELPTLKSCKYWSHLTIIKEFHEAVEDARLKVRILAGLLTVEKDTKLTSVKDFQSKKLILESILKRAKMLEQDLSFQKPWHIKYLLDFCVCSIFFNGPHSSCQCICRGILELATTCALSSFDSFCSNKTLSLIKFDSYSEDAMQAMEQFVGCENKSWSDALSSMFWNCAVCCFHVHKLFAAIGNCTGTMKVIHPYRSMRYDPLAMDPLDTGVFNAFKKEVSFTIFSGFVLEGRVLCKSQVYLWPKKPGIVL